jgi:lysine 2,3-aminomutase
VTLSTDWTTFKIWRNVSPIEFEDHLWQDKNSITRPLQLKQALDGMVSQEFLEEIETGLSQVGMAIRLNPYVMSLIDWSKPEVDPVRRQFLPMRSELEDDHPCLVFDSLKELEQAPVPGLVHRYPDKVLFLVTSVCPVYCQYCTRSYAVGDDTVLVQKERVTGSKNWTAALAYIRSHPEIVDVVVSGGDLARLKAENVRMLGHALLDIDHVRRLRFATKAVSVQPMKFLTDHDWVSAVLEIVERGRSMFKDVCLHTHFNHPNEITPFTERAMRVLHERGVFVRNQAVLLRGVNDNAETLKALIRGLGSHNIHPYYIYLCDMVKGTEHYRLPLATARHLEKEVRGATAGFNTPTFVVDTPGGKRDVHSVEFHESKYGVAVFTSPAVARGNQFYYFDPLRSLGYAGAMAWAVPDARENILAHVAAQMNPFAHVAAGEPRSTSLQPLGIVHRAEANDEGFAQGPLQDAA